MKEEEKQINTDVLKARMANIPKVNYSAILVVLLAAASFLIGRLSAQVEYLKSGVSIAAAPTAAPAAQQQQAPTVPEVTSEQIKALFNGKNITFGDKNKKVVFVEYSDPSCPYCHVAGGKNPELNKQIGTQFTMVADGGTYLPPVPEMKKLVDSGKAAFVWLYTNGHGNGEMATKALYCAYEKGKFWQVHDTLMTNKGYDFINNTLKNDKTKAADLANFLASVMNPNEMKNCLESGKYDGRIAEDSSIAQSMNASGTPHFFVNTTRFTGAYSYKDMESVVTASLK